MSSADKTAALQFEDSFNIDENDYNSNNIDEGDIDSDEFDNETIGRFLPEDTIWKICHDLAKGLAHIHALGMVHLDMKPSNIFFAEDKNYGCICKIGDFGMSVPIGMNEDGQEGDTLYMPKELLQEGSLKAPSADMFSLGLTLYELSAGPTFELPSEGEGWHEIRNGEMKNFPNNRSPQLASLIKKLISLNCENRGAAEEIGNIGQVQVNGGQKNLFLANFLQDVADMETLRERQLSATYRASRNKRFTPTNSILTGGGGGDYTAGGSAAGAGLGGNLNGNGSASGSQNNLDENGRGSIVYTPTPSDNVPHSFFLKGGGGGGV